MIADKDLLVKLQEEFVGVVARACPACAGAAGTGERRRRVNGLFESALRKSLYDWVR